MSSWVALAGSSGWSVAAEVVGQPNGAEEVGLEIPKAWSVLLVCLRRGRDLLWILRSLRELGDNVKELCDWVGLDANHQDST